MGRMVNMVKAPTKFILGSMASIGAGALAGYVMKNIDISNMRGIGKVCVGVGISGLALASGEMAKDAMDRKVDNSFKALGLIEDVIDGANNLNDAIKNFKDKVDAEMAEEVDINDKDDEAEDMFEEEL